MPVKAIVLDVSGTLIHEETGAVVAGVPEMIAALRQLQLHIVAVSNKAPTVSLEPLGVHEHELLDSTSAGGTKGTKHFVAAVCTRLDVQPNEILYLGDSDNDMREAVNNSVIFFLAAWSNPDYPYGIPVATPQLFVQIVETFFRKEHLWYYRIDDQDGAGRPVIVRALLDPDLAQDTGIKRLLKQKIDGQFSPAFTTSTFLSLHLLASVYGEGLHLLGKPGKPNLWCIYPGHDRTQTGVLTEFARIAARLFRKRYEPEVIVRHQPAIKSAYARANRTPPTITNQLTTIHLAPTLRSRIRGRTILLFDDFTTYAHSFETARNFFLTAGAERVVAIAVGKYRAPYQARVPQPGVVWNNFAPTTLEEADFTADLMTAAYDAAALAVFRRRS